MRLLYSEATEGFLMVEWKNMGLVSSFGYQHLLKFCTFEEEPKKHSRRTKAILWRHKGSMSFHKDTGLSSCLSSKGFHCSLTPRWVSVEKKTPFNTLPIKIVRSMILKYRYSVNKNSFLLFGGEILISIYDFCLFLALEQSYDNVYVRHDKAIFCRMNETRSSGRRELCHAIEITSSQTMQGDRKGTASGPILKRMSRWSCVNRIIRKAEGD